jgi:transposase
VKTTGVGGEERGYDGAKKVKGRKRHLLVDTQGLVLEVKVHSAKVVDREGIKLLLDPSSPDRLPRLSHLWLDAGYTGEGKGADWVQKVVGWTAEIVRHPPKLVPDEVMRRWVMEWAKEGVAIDRERFSPPEGPRPFLPKRWIVERTFSWLGQNRRMSKDYERLPETGEAFVFHADARMFGSIAGEREDVPIEELFAEAESAPGRHRQLPLAGLIGAADGGCSSWGGGRGGLLGDDVLHRLPPAGAYRGGLEDRLQAVRPHRWGAARGGLSNATWAGARGSFGPFSRPY